MYFGLLLVMTLSFGLFLWPVAVGVAASPQKHCRMTLLDIARILSRVNLSEVGAGQWSWARLV